MEQEPKITPEKEDFIKDIDQQEENSQDKKTIDDIDMDSLYNDKDGDYEHGWQKRHN